jgi:hypothetical protein
MNSVIVFDLRLSDRCCFRSQLHRNPSDNDPGLAELCPVIYNGLTTERVERGRNHPPLFRHTRWSLCV